MAFLSMPSIFCRVAPAIPSRCSTPSAYRFLQPSISNQYSLQLNPSCRLNLSVALCMSYEVGAGLAIWIVLSMKFFLKLEDMKMDEASEKVAVQLAAQGVIGKRVDEMESGFMMALDYMIQTAEKDQDVKSTAFTQGIFWVGMLITELFPLAQITLGSYQGDCIIPSCQEVPPSFIGLLCRTPQKESRHELLRRVAAGGGVFQSENGTKVHFPGVNLNDVANQADDILETMESRSVVPDRKLLARLVLIREEARNMMGGGMHDERNDRGLNTLPESEVNFLTKLVSLRPGKTVRNMIKHVMLGKEEGADSSDNEVGAAGGIAGRASVSGRKPLPVRPGMFLETVSKVLGGIYGGNVSGVTAQHLEWVHQNTLQILQEIAF